MAGRGPARMLEQETEIRIVQMSNEGMTDARIAQHFGIGRTTVQRTLSRNGISKSADRVRLPVSQEAKNEAVIDCRVNKMAIDDAARLHGMSPETLKRALKDQGVSLSLGTKDLREIDHTAFSRLTRENLYWMGWMFTDGCVSQDKYGPTIGMNIKETDRGHVEKFRSFLKSTHAITYCAAKTSVLKNGQVINGGASVTFRVRSEQLVADLNKWGMTWKKTLRQEIHPDLEASPDFWRGCVDGDGSIGLRQKEPPTPTFSLAGNLPLLRHFQKFLHLNDFPALQIGPTQSGIFRIGTEGSGAYRMICLLYGQGGPSLDRKNALAQRIIQEQAPRYSHIL